MQNFKTRGGDLAFLFKYFCTPGRQILFSATENFLFLNTSTPDIIIDLDVSKNLQHVENPRKWTKFFSRIATMFALNFSKSSIQKVPKFCQSIRLICFCLQENSLPGER